MDMCTEMQEMCTDMRTEHCIDMCTDMCMDTCTDMCMDMCTDMCMDMCTDMFMDMCMDICTDMCTDACMYISPDMRIHLCIDVCIDIFIDMHIYLDRERVSSTAHLSYYRLTLWLVTPKTKIIDLGREREVEHGDMPTAQVARGLCLVPSMSDPDVRRAVDTCMGMCIDVDLQHVAGGKCAGKCVGQWTCT